MGGGTEERNYQLHLAADDDGSNHTTEVAPELQVVFRSNSDAETADVEAEDDTDKRNVDANALESFELSGKAIKHFGGTMKKWYCAPTMLWHEKVLDELRGKI